MADLYSIPAFDTARHLKYWQRCLRSLLPQAYTSMDSTRMTLGTFVVSAFDLLSGPNNSATSQDGNPAQNQATTSPLSQSDRRRFREWVLSCQHAGGGFCGSPAHALPPYEYEDWDFAKEEGRMGNPGAANIAATSFALLLLALLAEEGEAESIFSKIDRARTLRWLRRLQRPDGSFGEVLIDIPDADGNESCLVGGGKDMRYCYLAAIIRWVLRGEVQEGDPAWIEDINIDALVGHIKQGQTYDGGFGESSQHESHAGYAFCATAALSLLDRAQESGATSQLPTILRKNINTGSLASWLAARQFAYGDPAAAVTQDEDNDPETANFPLPNLASLSVADDAMHIGFNGRCNKVADSCYCWWNIGSLSILSTDQASFQSFVQVAPARRFLLDKTQHLIGGFGKHPGSPPDLYHAYLGLAALATMGEPSLKKFDPALCVSVDTVRKVEAARRELLRRARGERNVDQGLVDLGVKLAGGQAPPAWLGVES